MRTFSTDDIPLLASRFAVSIDGIIEGTFAECSGLSGTIEVEKYMEGGWNHSPRKFPSKVDYGNITLKHGQLASWALYDWFVRAAHGEDRAKAGGARGSGGALRRTVSVMLYDNREQPVAQWNLRRAFPVKWTGPSLQTSANNPAVVSIELAHEGLIQDQSAGRR